MPTERKLRVLLVDDHQMMRAGLRSILESRVDLMIVGEAEDGRAAVELTRALTPDIILMDVTMPRLNGIDATKQILAINPGIKVIVLSMHSDRHVITEMLRAGAMAYLLKNSAATELLLAIEATMNGKTYLSPEAANVAVDNLLGRKTVSQSGRFENLTPREREVLQLIAEGKTNKEIANQLAIGVKTVEGYRAQLMDKLNLRTVAELTKYAIRHGITPLDT